jgi:hypothetical protein
VKKEINNKEGLLMQVFQEVEVYFSLKVFELS